MALGILLIGFIGMSAISILGLLLMYLLKNKRAKAIVFYCMAVWSMVITAISAVSLPSNYTVSRLITWGFGFLSVIALILHVRSRSKSLYMVSYILVTISVIAGIVKMYLL